VFIPTTGKEPDAKIHNHVESLLPVSTSSAIFREVFDKENEK